MKRARVNRNHRCPICGKDSWCLVSESDAICMRVASDKTIHFADGSDGWLHPINFQTVAVTVSVKDEPAPIINATQLWEEMKESTTGAQIVALANSLAVSASSLVDLGAAWSNRYQAWAFPMRDGNNAIVGIRLRSWNGQKWAVKGSHQGLFIPQGWRHPELFVCEGPTDTAAALSMGLFAVGRPCCTGCVDQLLTYIQRANIRRVVILSDNDAHDAGLRGAQTFSAHCPCPHCMMLLPCKDVRDYVQLGGTRQLLDDMMKNVIWECANVASEPLPPVPGTDDRMKP